MRVLISTLLAVIQLEWGIQSRREIYMMQITGRRCCQWHLALSGSISCLLRLLHMTRLRIKWHSLIHQGLKIFFSFLAPRCEHWQRTRKTLQMDLCAPVDGKSWLNTMIAWLQLKMAGSLNPLQFEGAVLVIQICSVPSGKLSKHNLVTCV
nr:hypothetical protein Iba_scaffold906250CG0010 [Ipomoea batatas]GMD79354.1 hypothetical protein Iba_chr13dCG3060 [Ipomoea batatas]